MEEYLVNKGSFESGFLCMDGNTREDPHFGQPEEKTDRGDKSMLFVYVGWGVS
jgi:hypothetical protein